MQRVTRNNTSYNHLKTPERSVILTTPFRPKTASRILPEVYHGSTLLHRTPGRHTDISLLRSCSSKKVALSRVQSDILTSNATVLPRRQIRQSQPPKPSEQRRIPISKAEGEMILFREIFVKPKEEKLEQLKMLMQNENFSELLFDKRLGSAVKNEVQEKTEEEEKEEAMMKLKVLDGKVGFFDQQIQVQPPEGLNATIAAPLTPGGGWAPSIPPSSSAIKSVGLKDMTLRAKSGVQAGDVQREAHMSYSLAVLNEENSKYTEALKFYKRFFFCAKVLDDPIGAALALNRLGIVYYNLGKVEKSISFHLKHAEFSDKDNKFAAYYNLGISYRHTDSLKNSLKYLTKALGWANKKSSLESQCITLGQLGLSFKALNDYKNSLHNLENCFNFARNLKNEELQMEVCVILGGLCYENEEWKLAAKYFGFGLGAAKNLGNHAVADLCACNLGIMEANQRFMGVQTSIMQKVLSKSSL